MIRKCIPCAGSGILTASDGSWRNIPGEWIDDTRDGQYCLCYACEGEGVTYDIESEALDGIGAELESLQRPAFGSKGWFEIAAKDHRGR